MPQGSFSATVSGWAAETQQRTEAVFKMAAQDVINESRKPVAKGGNMPVDTGFLRASLDVNLSGNLPATRKNEGKVPPPQDISLAIAQAELGQTIYASYTANYALHQEYGARGRPGRAFVRLAAQRWQTIVNNAARRLQRKVKARQSR